MRIGIYFGPMDPHLGGAGTILSTIKKEILSKTNDKYEFVFIYSGGRNAKEVIIDGNRFVNVDRQISITKKIKEKIGKVLNIDISKYSRFDAIGKNENIDLFWITSPEDINISYPFIYTIWDLGYRTVPFFPEVSVEGEWEKREKRYSVMSAKSTYLITGNEEGKKEILTNFNIPEEKIKILPFPISAFCYGKEKKPNFDLDEYYFFYPAQFWSHKNHVCIVEAIQYLKQTFNYCPKVYFTGTDKGNKKYIESLISENHLENNIVFTGFLDDQELKYMYTHATAMIFASLMGPNNLPPLEAAYLGCPIIITDLQGHREQLKDAALYFNGYDCIELAKAMRTLMTDAKLRSELISKESILMNNRNNYSYCDTMFSIFDDFNQKLKRWKK